MLLPWSIVDQPSRNSQTDIHNGDEKFGAYFGETVNDKNRSKDHERGFRTSNPKKSSLYTRISTKFAQYEIMALARFDGFGPFLLKIVLRSFEGTCCTIFNTLPSKPQSIRIGNNDLVLTSQSALELVQSCRLQVEEDLNIVLPSAIFGFNTAFPFLQSLPTDRWTKAEDKILTDIVQSFFDGTSQHTTKSEVIGEIRYQLEQHRLSRPQCFTLKRTYNAVYARISKFGYIVSTISHEAALHQRRIDRVQISTAEGAMVSLREFWQREASAIARAMEITSAARADIMDKLIRSMMAVVQDPTVCQLSDPIIDRAVLVPNYTQASDVATKALGALGVKELRLIPQVPKRSRSGFLSSDDYVNVIALTYRPSSTPSMFPTTILAAGVLDFHITTICNLILSWTQLGRVLNPAQTPRNKLQLELDFWSDLRLALRYRKSHCDDNEDKLDLISNRGIISPQNKPVVIPGPAEMALFEDWCVIAVAEPHRLPTISTDVKGNTLAAIIQESNRRWPNGYSKYQGPLGMHNIPNSSIKYINFDQIEELRAAFIKEAPLDAREWLRAKMRQIITSPKSKERDRQDMNSRRFESSKVETTPSVPTGNNSTTEIKLPRHALESMPGGDLHAAKRPSSSRESDAKRMRLDHEIQSSLDSRTSLDNSDEEDEGQVFPCPFLECQETFTSQRSLEQHERAHRPWVCDVAGCDKRYTALDGLTKHRKSHAATEEERKPHTCDVTSCNKRYATLDGLTIHRRSHAPTEEEQKPFICDTPNCGKRFTRLQNLIQHKPSHTSTEEEQKPHACDVTSCNKRYTSLQNLIQHKHSHASTEEERRPYVCDIPGCDKRYNKRCSLTRHQKRHED